MEKIRRITDTHCIAYLLSKGFRETTLPKKQGSMIYFCFKDTPNLEKEIETYFCGTPIVNVQEFGIHLKCVRLVVAEMKHIGGDQHE
jgi:hypothetical protein